MDDGIRAELEEIKDELFDAWMSLSRMRRDAPFHYPWPLLHAASDNLDAARENLEVLINALPGKEKSQ